MFGALTSLTGGGGLSGGAATNGDLRSTSDLSTNAGNVSNGGLTINEGFKFNPENPMHLAGAAVAVIVGGALVIKAVKS